jgi:prolyl-tRNA synthetase
VYQSQLINRTLPDVAQTDDAGERLLLTSGCIFKAASGVYAYPPFGMRIRRRLIQLFAQHVEASGYEAGQFSVISPADEHCGAEKYGAFACRLESSYLSGCALAARSEEAISRMLREAAPEAAWFERAAVWAVSREFRAGGGGRGYRRSVEYENLTAWLCVKSDVQGFATELREIGTRVSATLGLDVDWSAERSSRTGESDACDMESPIGEAAPFRVGQLCLFSAASVAKLGMARFGAAACLTISINRTLYALARRLAQRPSSTWPSAIAPFACHIVMAAARPDQSICELADRLHARLEAEGIPTLVDDRPISAGRKLYDSDLLRLPVRLVLGAAAKTDHRAGLRGGGMAEAEVPVDQSFERIRAFIAQPEVSAV